MIRFIQDYTTKALPPEHFEEDQEVKRSPESELYFVRLGVAGFVHEGNLVDQDYQPIVRTTVVEVVAVSDRRFADGGRGGELLGIEAPQRASTGPGNAAMFGGANLLGTPDADLHRVQVEQLSSDLAASIQQLDDHRGETTKQIDALTTDLTTAQGARETALSNLATVQSERDSAVSDLSALNEQHAALQAEHQVAQARVADLEQQIAASGSGGDASQDGNATKPAKAAK